MIRYHIPAGFRAAAVRSGIKPSGSPDLALFVASKPCSAAGVFTTNRIAAAPVKWDRRIVPSESVMGIVINAGNANAATGDEGFRNARTTAELLASKIGCEPDQILVASTGVIGRQLPMDKLTAGVSSAFDRLTIEEEGFLDAAHAILTTDTRIKVASRVISLDDREIHILGIAKGAAMMGPNMATMLAFVLTDAPVASADLDAILRTSVDDSFHCISVEGHTSTNDTVLLLASGAAGGTRLAGESLVSFASTVADLCRDLARMIPDDGEGATHLITIDVSGCRTREDARSIAKTVADSALVKTAIAGGDPNWGRIVSAAGYSGVEFDETELSLSLNGFPLYRDGAPLPFDAETVSNSIKNERETRIELALKRGSSSIRFWTCDLTTEYVHINADYTT
jgi:glutamate N-acetyltransferase/amino-acid N-acetyltransferase